MSDPEKYTVGWICANDTEAVAAVAFFDEEHRPISDGVPNGNNSYELGRMGQHHVVIAILPDGEYGTSSAASVARDMAHTFPNIRIGLMVGIGGGVPSPEHDIRLGDIVVSRPEGGMGGVIQYDFGKTIQDQTFRLTGFLNQPPTLLRTAVSALRRRYRGKGHTLVEEAGKALATIKRKKQFARPPPTTDRLYGSDIVHKAGGRGSRHDCEVSCGSNDGDLIIREDRDEEDDDPVIHYGLIASGNQLMKDARIRDRLAAEKDVLCFDMEAAGLMNHFPCIVIRGICDYADSHKNKDWQGFAALMAAAYAKDLLRQIHPSTVEAQVRVIDLLTEVERKINIIQTSTESIQSNLHSAEMKLWLSPPDPSTNANVARKVRQEGSGSWLLQSSTFQAWYSGLFHHTWIRGLAGCGKTVLSTVVLDHLAARIAQTTTPDHVVLSYFFDFADRGKQTVDSMLRSLAFQLYTEGPEPTREPLDELHKEHSNGAHQPTTAELDSTVCRILAAQGKRVYILLDALDEATERQTLLDWVVKAYHAPELRHVQLLYTSRPESEFIGTIPQTIDIRAYVTTKLREEPFIHQNLSDDLQTQIQDKVGNGADGMFRWATCQLETLARCTTPYATRKALRHLPKDLHQTYARIMNSIPDDLARDTARLLQFLLYAERPLTLAEAVEVIATTVEEMETPNFDIERRLHHPNDILHYCPGLLSVVDGNAEDDDGDDDEAAEDGKRKTKEIHLAHFSVKEYLLTLDQFSNVIKSNLCIARTSLTYLTYLTSKTHRTANSSQAVQQHVLSDFPLRWYAARHWMTHTAATASLCQTPGQLLDEAMAFLNDPVSFETWRLLLDWEYQGESPLTYACVSRCLEIAQRLLDEGAPVNSPSGSFGNALQAASLRGYPEIVQLLLDRGADVNALGGHFGTALQAASAGSTESHREVVRLLWDRGADVNVSHCGQYGTALQAASYGGTAVHREIVHFLLDKGADANARGGNYHTALYAAASRGTEGHTDIIRLLVDKGGADTNAQSTSYGNALYAASYGGHRDTVQLLIDKGAQVNTPLPGGLYANALQAAAEGGYGAIVQLLVGQGADINAPGGHFGNALQAACDGGYVDVIKLLLDAKASINAVGGYHGSALQALCVRGHQDMVDLFLSRGALVDTGSGKYGSALQAAATGGHQEIARLLLGNGANINACGGLLGTALQAAAEGGYQKTVQLLLDHGAAVDAQPCGRYNSALQAASARGYLAIVQLLLSHGADVNAQGPGSYDNALCAASYHGHRDIVRLLLDNGADIITTSTGTGSCQNALEAATAAGQAEIIQLLGDRLADLLVTVIGR